MTERLTIEHADGVLRIAMDRPDVLNALSAKMADRIAEEIEQAPARDDVRVVLLAGNDVAFSAGADIGGAEAHESFDITSLDRANRMVRAVIASPLPCVASVRGVAAGVGCSLALACDLAVAAESARFLLGFSRIGLMPDGGATATVAASVGRARAMRMALLGEALSAREAYDAGLVSHLASDPDHQGLVERLVSRLAGGPPLALTATKRAVNAAALPGLEAALERERSAQVVLLRTSDAAEGIRAFGEQRSPVFRGE